MKPMLAASQQPDLNDISYPVLVSPKLDGIRCVIKDGKVLSRTLKPIPNLFVQSELPVTLMEGFDGELMVDGDFNSVQSAIMSQSGTPDFTFNVFDDHSFPGRPFMERSQAVQSDVISLDHPRVKLVNQELICTPDELKECLGDYLCKGYEGVIVRDPQAPYKYGRSTLNQGWMLKLKPFHDDEATVIGFEELMHNLDTSSHKLENQVPGNKLGALVVEWQGKEFKLGTGFDNEQRERYWRDRDSLLGSKATFKYQELSRYGIPRIPVFKGFRDGRDT